MDRAELERLDREGLVMRAQAAGVKRARLLTRPELVDELLRLDPNIDPTQLKRTRGFFGRARDLLSRVVERGLHLPDAADRLRAALGSPLPDVQRPESQAVPTVTLAEIYAAQGHKQRAMETLRRVLEAEPDHGGARALLVKLEAVDYVAPEPPLPPETDETARDEIGGNLVQPEGPGPEVRAERGRQPEGPGPEVRAERGRQPEGPGPEVRAERGRQPEGPGPEVRAERGRQPEGPGPEVRAERGRQPEGPGPEVRAERGRQPEGPGPEVRAERGRQPEGPESESPETENPETESAAERDMPTAVLDEPPTLPRNRPEAGTRDECVAIPIGHDCSYVWWRLSAATLHLLADDTFFVRALILHPTWTGPEHELRDTACDPAAGELLLHRVPAGAVVRIAVGTLDAGKSTFVPFAHSPAIESTEAGEGGALGTPSASRRPLVRRTLEGATPIALEDPRSASIATAAERAAEVAEHAAALHI